jgi:hypothetical protein
MRDYGCFFLCIARLAEKAAGVEFDTAELLRFRDYAQKYGIIGADMLVLKQAELFMFMSKKLCEYTKLETKPDDGDYIIENAGETAKGEAVTHFTAFVDGADFDPLPPDRAHVKYRAKSYRLFET